MYINAGEADDNYNLFRCFETKIASLNHHTHPQLRCAKLFTNYKDVKTSTDIKRKDQISIYITSLNFTMYPAATRTCGNTKSVPLLCHGFLGRPFGSIRGSDISCVYASVSIFLHEQWLFYHRKRSAKSFVLFSEKYLQKRILIFHTVNGSNPAEIVSVLV